MLIDHREFGFDWISVQKINLRCCPCPAEELSCQCRQLCPVAWAASTVTTRRHPTPFPPQPRPRSAATPQGGLIVRQPCVGAAGLGAGACSFRARARVAHGNSIVRRSQLSWLLARANGYDGAASSGYKNRSNWVATRLIGTTVRTSRAWGSVCSRWLLRELFD